MPEIRMNKECEGLYRCINKDTKLVNYVHSIELKNSCCDLVQKILEDWKEIQCVCTENPCKFA